MTCYHPVQSYRSDDGEIHFGDKGDGRVLYLPCGKCLGCRWTRSQAWAIRCMHEAQMHPISSFVTLTYDGEIDPSLNYSDFQNFTNRVRRRLGPMRYFCAGEYGDRDGRPHFHALLFGVDFLSDSRTWGKNLYRSPALESLWTSGYSTVGEVTHDSASYCAQYTVKKHDSNSNPEHYLRVDKRTGEFVFVQPEFGHMSLKPGIGYSWLLKYWREVYSARQGEVTFHGGRKTPSPRFYDKMVERWAESDERFRFLSMEVQASRMLRALERASDNTPERLSVREVVHASRYKFFRRNTL